MTTVWQPDTCLCVADQETRTLIIRCLAHNNYLQMRTHNNRPEFAESDDEIHVARRKAERAKPLFKTRPSDLNIKLPRGHVRVRFG